MIMNIILIVKFEFVILKIGKLYLNIFVLIKFIILLCNMWLIKFFKVLVNNRFIVICINKLNCVFLI